MLSNYYYITNTITFSRLDLTNIHKIKMITKLLDIRIKLVKQNEQEH